MNGDAQASTRGRHVFIVVESGQASKGLDWTAIRQNIAATGGYLSLALIDGSRSNWIVRPVPTADQIPAQVSTVGAGTASPGVAAAIIDQLMEAQGLVPAIQTTEVRLYGAALAETELNDALSGEKTVQLRVFDKSALRTARSTYKPPAAAAQKPATGRAGRASSTQTAGKSAAASTSLPPAYYLRQQARKAPPSVGQATPQAPNPVRQAARPSPVPPTTAPIVTTPATVAASTPTAGIPQSTTAPSSREGFVARFKPMRRLFAGILAAMTVLLGVFPGYVWTNIWGYSYPRDAALIADVVSYAQSRAFGVALLFGALIALVGTRARWLTMLGFGYGLLSGVMPGVIPDFLVWPAPPIIAGVLMNTASFWGMWMAYAPVLYIGLGVAVISTVAKVLPETPQSVVAARARNRVSTRDWLGKRSLVDKFAISLLLWSAFTAVVPWLVGRFVLQDNILFSAGSGVFDTDAREFWAYALPLYVGGMAALFVLAGLAMVLQPWSGRKGAGIAGLFLVAAGLVAGHFGTTLWTSAEEGTAARLMSTAFPFDDQFLTCGHAEAVLTDDSGESWLYQVWTARIKGSDVGSRDCNRIQVYKGWQHMDTKDLPEGQVVTDGPDFVSGTTVADAVFQYVQSDGQTIQLPVNGQ
ncbi:hypothetical protein [Nostocoides australiense]|uniref:hypothetical protein n=1 Tax=Nostocoides australiense TaxID=99480 RepID=UPI0012ECCFE2|nr:hypothetical protein [Tetrasphaera australiensis]